MRQLDLRRIPKDVLEELRRIVTPDKDGRLDWKSLTVFTARHWKSFLVVGGIMAVVSYLVVKSGLAASVLNKMRRQRFAGVEIDPPVAGIFGPFRVEVAGAGHGVVAVPSRVQPAHVAADPVGLYGPEPLGDGV